MDKFKIETTTKIAAIEQLLVMTMALQYVQLGYTEETVDALHSGLIEKAKSETFPGADPALGDMASGEYSDRIEDLLSRTFDVLRGLKRQLSPE
ncbi:hypothetical protein P7L87_24980 [Vibrio parahaemolyticus]|nr:hypothetical protein [Vibrio parahaemolyticus]